MRKRGKQRKPGRLILSCWRGFSPNPADANKWVSLKSGAAPLVGKA
jgi:hypothetical protein